MKELLAGLASGAFMASVFVAVGASMVVSLAQSPPVIMERLLDRFSPVQLVMPVVILSYPVWGIVGVVLALLYAAAEEAAPAGGLGSPNLFYTIMVAGLALLTVAPLLILLRRAQLQLVLSGGTFIGVFGWMLPFFAT